MKLVVGLGNPGKKYDLTRHNVGFLAVEALINRFISSRAAEISASEKTKKVHVTSLSMRLADGGECEDVEFLKPLTYMNRSGECVRERIMRLPKQSHFDVGSDLVVVHDDVDLPFGKIRFDRNKSSAGHRGVGNIIDQLHTKDFTRIRIGIRSADLEKGETESYVLKRFSKTEQQLLEALFHQCADAFLILLERGFAAAQNFIHAEKIKKTSRGREVLSC